MVFCSHGLFDIDFLFFKFFLPIFFRNGFPNSLIVRSRSSFLFSQWKFIELHVRTCPAMFLLFFTGSFINAAFDLKVKARKTHGEQIFSKREKVFDHALCSVKDFLT